MNTIRIKVAEPVVPQCYAYTLPESPVHKGWTKIGFTERDVDTRIKEQTHTANLAYKKCWSLRAAFLTDPFETFTDRDFHGYLLKLGVERKERCEWFRIDPEIAKNKFLEFTLNHGVVSEGETQIAHSYTLREEQQEAVTQTFKYFTKWDDAEFLWNAKPRFGKTLAAYDLCMQLSKKDPNRAFNILIVTNRPAIANSWYQDYETFFGPKSGFLFVSNIDSLKGKKYVNSREEYVNRLSTQTKGCIEFVSLQDLKGSIYFGGQYKKLSELSDEGGILWDIMIVDEAHEGVDTFKTDTAFNHIPRKWTLHLSGTPFKALANDKFPSEAIFNWTYADEQKKKRDWDPSNEEDSPYSTLPALSLFTYQMSDIVREKVQRGIEINDNETVDFAFDLNEFFRTSEAGTFLHDKEVTKFLDALVTQSKFPFSSSGLRNELKHTFWLLSRVSSAKALAKKLKTHSIFKDYFIILAAGDGKLDEETESEQAFNRVKSAIAQHEKTITLSVGQLTTGVTIPEWSAVLMLSNMASPALYMQAAFRAQNPCLFMDSKKNSFRKQNAYVFDFDPARTLSIYAQFANDLVPSDAGQREDLDQRKRNLRELLNFFPVYGEDDNGSMIELDAEKVLTIPRRIHAREVVARGFMSNFLFSNIAGIFGAPKEILNVIKNMQAIEEPKGMLPLDEISAQELGLNKNGEIEISKEHIIGTATQCFGEKVYANVEEELANLKDHLISSIDTIQAENKAKPDESKEQLNLIREQFAQLITTTLIETAKERYGQELRKSTQKQLNRKIRENIDKVVDREFGDHSIRMNQLKQDYDDKISVAQLAGSNSREINKITEEYRTSCRQSYEEMVCNIDSHLKNEETVKKAAEAIVETVETEKLEAKKNSLEHTIRDHLRGFSRTIPAFLMAYGDKTTTLANFDTLVPEDVFWEVTVNPQSGEGITLDQFRMLRDGGDYVSETGEEKHYDGHLFDEVVFNDAVQEFMKKREELADYFNTDHSDDIFNYIPPQRTNQIFTPRKVVIDMVDRLEKENPGCFDDDKATFADLYMKSGMYISEIVTRLYQSERMKLLYPNEVERLNHIFANQIYGCAPTEIIYRICRNYILGFSNKIHIDRNNIYLYDTLTSAKKGNLEEEMKKLFKL